MNARRYGPSGLGARGTAGAGLAAIVLLGAVLMAPAHVLAHACDRTDNDRREASRVIRNLTQEIDAMERAIVEALRLQTGQLSGYTAQSARAIAGRYDIPVQVDGQRGHLTSAGAGRGAAGAAVRARASGSALVRQRGPRGRRAGGRSPAAGNARP
jgi:hypothetical protein